MLQKVGIDAGGSLIKIAYEEKGKLHVKTFSNQKMEPLIEWLNMIAPQANFLVTGGKSGQIKNLLKNKCESVEEFEAVVNGTRFLLDLEQKEQLEDYILVSIGTGTSIYYVTSNSFERLVGSAIGGGTFIGLGSLVANTDQFSELVEMASKGNRSKIDLLVKDIYAPDEPPLLGELTAASFGKAHLQQNNSMNDKLASVVQMLGETIITLSVQSAAMKQVDKIVFVGSTLNGNTPLRAVLRSFRNLYPYEPFFLERGAYAGAIGALIHK